MKEMIQNAVDAIRAVAGARPSVGLILGSGLGGLADVLEDASFVEYASFPPRRGTRDVLCWAVWPDTASCACRGVFIFMRDIPCPTSPRPSV